MNKKIIALGLTGLTLLSGFTIADNTTQTDNSTVNTTSNITISTNTNANTPNPTINPVTTISPNTEGTLNVEKDTRIEKVISRIQNEIGSLDLLIVRYGPQGNNKLLQGLVALRTYEQNNVLTPLTNAQATGNPTMIMNALRQASEAYPHIPATITSAGLRVLIDKIKAKTQDSKTLQLLDTASGDLDQVSQLASEGRKYETGDLNKVWKELIPDARKNINTAILWLGVNNFADAWNKKLVDFETKNNVTDNNTSVTAVKTAISDLQNILNPTVKTINIAKNKIVKTFNQMRNDFAKEKRKKQQEDQKQRRMKQQEKQKEQKQLQQQKREINKDIRKIENEQKNFPKKNGKSENNETGSNSTNSTG